jgi:F0F1-type ATP synthase assembly protein I
MTDIAFSLVMPIVFGFFIGRYIDGLIHSKFPLWTILFSLFGVFTGMWSVYKRYIKR